MPVNLVKLEAQFKKFFEETTQEEFEQFIAARLKPNQSESQEEMWMEVYKSTNDDNYDRWEERIKKSFIITRKQVK